MPFKNTPIKRKLTTVILLTSGTVLLLTSVTFLIYEFVTFRKDAVRDISTLGRIIAANSTAALAFDDRDAAREILSTLLVEKQIVAASLYDRDGNLFAYYPYDLMPSDLPTRPGAVRYDFEGSYLAGFQPVVQGDRHLGALYIRSNLQAMYDRFRVYSLTGFLVVAITLLLAYVLSRVLQRQISRPILRLAETARAISERHDYSVRATKVGEDELGLLTDAFNHMLRQIQNQNQALSESEARVRSVLNSAISAVVVMDAVGKITDWNARAETIFGWRRKEALGQELAELIIPRRLRDKHRRGLSEFLSTGETAVMNQVIEMTALHRDGSEFPTELFVSPLKTNESTSFCGFITDITERKQAEQAVRQSEQRFSSFMEHLPGLTWIKDAQGRYVYANAAAETAFGITAQELFGKTDEEVFPAETAAQFRNNDRLALESEAGVQMIEELEQDDGVHVSIVSKFRLPAIADSTQLIGGVAIDITKQKQAEEAMLRSEQQLRLVIDALPAVVTYVDRDHRYRFFNRALCEWFALNPEEVQDRTALEIMGESAYQAVRPKMDLALSGQSVRYEAELPYRYGGTRAVEVSYVPDIQPDGNVEGYIALIHDITESKRAEAALRESESRFRTMADSAPVLIWVNDAEGCEFVNREYLRVLGCSLEEVLGMMWTRFVHPEDVADYVATYREAFEQKQPFDCQLRFKRADGEYRWFRSTGVPRFTNEGSVFGFVGCSVDITEIKRSEEALKEADRRKDAFLATLAHELRNPLAPIRTGLEIMKVAKNNGDPVEETRAMMERQLTQMVRLIDDLLDVSRISRGKFELRKEHVKMSEVVESAIETSRPLIEQFKHEFAVDIPSQPIFVDADLTRLAQALSNLLNNAARYTPPGGHIWLTAQRDQDRVVLSVKDNGAGIEPEVLPYVFEIFSQARRSPRNAHGGLGIGLSLVKQLVEMHGGTVKGHSEGPGQGSEFIIRLPVLKSAAPQAGVSGKEQEASGATGGHRILVADDNEDFAESLSTLLEMQDHEVHIAHDGLKVVEMAKELRPDLILLDIGMPRLDGHAACRRIRQEPWGDETIIVAVTGWGHDDDRSKSKEAGFDYHLVKPIQFESLEKVLAELPERATK